jgi:hypothetical protein
MLLLRLAPDVCRCCGLLLLLLLADDDADAAAACVGLLGSLHCSRMFEKATKKRLSIFKIM